MLKMNYSNFCFKNIDQIRKEATRRGIPMSICGRRKSKDDLIGEIIAHDAYHEGRNDAMRYMPDKFNKNIKSKTDAISNNREEYYLTETADDCSYYLRLTREQVNFANWCIENEIDFYSRDLKKVNDQEYVSP